MEQVSWDQSADWAAVAPLIQARQQAVAGRVAAAPQNAEPNATDARAPVAARDAQARDTQARDAQGLTEAEQAQVRDLRARDREVRNHEQAHARVGGQYAGQPTYSYQVGPDGQRYAIGGAGSIDVTPIADDPQATIQKMEVVKAAALAPAKPSSADRQVASLADAQMAQAQADLMAQRMAERSGTVDRRA